MEIYFILALTWALFSCFKQLQRTDYPQSILKSKLRLLTLFIFNFIAFPISLSMYIWKKYISFRG
jgi:hypothetical protein